MSRGAVFVRFYPSDWRSGCIGLSFEQEGLYVRICAYIYETRKRIPASDSAAARILGANTNAYTKVRKQLCALGLLTERDGEWTVSRAEVELAKVDAARSEIEVERRVAPRSERETSTDAIEATPQHTPTPTPPAQAEKTQSFLRATKEPITNSHSPRARGGDYWQKTLNPSADYGVQVSDDGRVVLVNGTRAEWLGKFDGDATALDLALGTIAVQPHSSEGTCKQVERQLSRIAMQRHDSDRRYKQAKVASKSTDQQAHRVSPDVVRFAKPKLELQPWETPDA